MNAVTLIGIEPGMQSFRLRAQDGSGRLVTAEDCAARLSTPVEDCAVLAAEDCTPLVSQ